MFKQVLRSFFYFSFFNLLVDLIVPFFFFKYTSTFPVLYFPLSFFFSPPFFVFGFFQIIAAVVPFALFITASKDGTMFLCHTGRDVSTC